MITLDTQIWILIYSFISGILFGVSFDIYKIIIGHSSNKLFNFLKDILFWVLIGVLIFCFLLYTQYAILSLYTYFYIFFGIVTYFKIISRFVFSIIETIVNKISITLRLIFKNIFYFIFSIFNKKNNKSL